MMPYCPKCGVEVDTVVKKYPLCNVQIPEIDKKEDNDNDTIQSHKFPHPENVYTGKMIDIKKKTFYALTSFYVIHLLLLFFWHLFDGKVGWGTLYITAITSSFWFYLFIFFGFNRNKKIMITSLILNTFFFTFLLDIFNGLYWFVSIFVPSTILGSVILIITAIIIRYSKKRSVNLVFPVSIAIVFFFIGVECIFSLKSVQHIVLL